MNNCPFTPLWPAGHLALAAELSHVEVRANFPLSVSGCALDTSPPKGVEEVRELAATGTFLAPSRAELSHVGNCPLIRPRSARPPSPRWGEEGAAARPATSSPLGERVARAKPEPGEGARAGRPEGGETALPSEVVQE